MAALSPNITIMLRAAEKRQNRSFVILAKLKTFRSRVRALQILSRQQICAPKRLFLKI